MYERSYIFKLYKKVYFFITWLFYKLFTNVHIGKNSRIESSATIYGNIHIGDNVSIGKDVLISGNISIGDNTSIHNFTKITTMKNSFISIGKNCLIGQYNIIGSCNYLTIEDDVLFAAGVKIFNGNHGITELIHEERIKDTPLNCEKMIIGRNSWLGFDVNLIKGGQIGNNCIVGAKSVVNTIIEPNSIAVGICAKVIKKREYKQNIHDNLQLQKYINILKETIELFDEKIVIYGAGSVTNIFFPLIKNKVVGIVDKDINKIGTNIENINIRHPEELHLISFDKIFISVLGRENEIESYLINELKIDNNKIIKLNLNDTH